MNGSLEKDIEEALKDFDPLKDIKKVLEKEESFAKDERAHAIIKEQRDFADGLWRGKDCRGMLVEKFLKEEWFATDESAWIDFIAELTGRDKKDIMYDKELVGKVVWLFILACDEGARCQKQLDIQVTHLQILKSLDDVREDAVTNYTKGEMNGEDYEKSGGSYERDD